MTSIASCTPNKPYVVLNAVEDRVQVLAGIRDQILFFQETAIQARAMQILPPAVQHCLRTLNMQVSDLGAVVAVRGPGTFTGVRVTTAFAFGLARGRGLPLAGLDYLPLLATPGRLLHAEIWVCTHARKDLVHVQGFSAPAIEPLGPPQAMSRERAAVMIRSGAGWKYALGSGLRRDHDLWRTALGDVCILEPAWDHPRPEALALAAQHAGVSHDPVLPVYLRHSDAELQLEGIARGRGVDPETARRAIPDYGVNSWTGNGQADG